MRTLSLVLLVAAVGLTILHVATDAGDDQEAAGWIAWTAAGLAFAAAGVGFLGQRQAQAPRQPDRER